ncbi:MAG: hypothetical protein WBB17_04660 [Saprospiraceae bacterium]|jgi:phage shock protein PspC (stress-responsive transcriptional regulator)|nr:hypothetical protein [Saprospiraceae bacterium]MBK7465366.1 hypothetical protein [Saprospiraceae bacterium]
MKNLLFILILIITSPLLYSENNSLLYLFLISGIASFFLIEKKSMAFAIGLSVVFTLWMIYLYITLLTTSSTIIPMIGETFQGLSQFSLITISAMIGGITAGLGASLGAQIKTLLYE